jgi:hypothetical protein
MNRHWTVDELTDRLYGIREADEHLESCRECASRLEDLDLRRSATAAPPPIPAGQLAAQRSSVLRRVEAPSRGLLWVPALSAAACLAGVALFVHKPVQVTPKGGDPVVTAAASDTQLFADIYSLEESAEPRAAAPMHALFEEGQQ